MKNSVQRLAMIIGTVCLLSLPAVTLAAGLNSTVNSFDGTATGTLSGAITRIVNYLLIIVGLVATIYLIWAGVKYITSAGDEDKAGEAKTQILYALIGIIVIGLSAVAVNFILGALNTAI